MLNTWFMSCFLIEMRSERIPGLGKPDRIQVASDQSWTSPATYLFEGYNLEEWRNQSHGIYSRNINTNFQKVEENKYFYSNCQKPHWKENILDLWILSVTSAVLSSPYPLGYTPGLLQFKNISRDKYTELSTFNDQSTVLRDRCKSDIAFIDWRVTWNYASVPLI